MAPTNLDRLAADLVLIVDDIPENLAVLHDALDDAGHTVLVAINGASALERAAHSLPDVILLDAVMPGMDGFEVARRLKADFRTQHIPIIFMTGLTETEHVVAAFAAGSADYVTKPIRPPEVLARIAAHTRNAREIKQARSALDALGQATLALRPGSARPTWQTPLARRLIKDYFGAEGDGLPEDIVRWIAAIDAARREGVDAPAYQRVQGARRLICNFHSQTAQGEWLLLLREESDAAAIDALMQGFKLTQREAEVLHWVGKGKTNRDIGEILGTSPRTVNKHLEHVFEKLGVETRTAAANLAANRLRQVSG